VADDGSRVAIVGLGPKGLFALERLLDHAHRASDRASLDIDIFEPHSTPGAGPVYDPRQPDYLRMNLAADHLDMWWPDSRAVPAAGRMSFVEWRRAVGDVALADERFPPRALVGRYLADGFERMRGHVPPGIRVALRSTTVCAAQRRDSRWRIVAADGSSGDYDEVLIAVGHQTRPDPHVSGFWTHAAPLIPAVFPVTRELSRDRVAPGASVAVRGFALTFLDAALALTEGRGGRFEGGDHPYRLTYTPSADDVGAVLPFSRTGRPMLAKPEPELAADIPGLRALTQSGHEQILALTDALTISSDIARILTDTVALTLQAADGTRQTTRQTRRAQAAAKYWLMGAYGGAPPVAAVDAAAEIERSLQIGAGLHPPDLQWAFGESWRGLYPALVARLTGAQLPDRSWRQFRRLAVQMERVAFGPPAVNAAKLHALVMARRVDLTHVVGGQLTTRDRTTAMHSAGGDPCPVDAVVNAVLPAPGARDAQGGLLVQLVADGYARMVFGRRGLEVGSDAGCIGSAGHRTAGLAAAGRPTEDSVVGNDTLNRALHPQVDRWASQVIERATAPDAALRSGRARLMA
jgi:uncharacterized NAD(P)/FAD-binding protein YdhS